MLPDNPSNDFCAGTEIRLKGFSLVGGSWSLTNSANGITQTGSLAYGPITITPTFQPTIPGVYTYVLTATSPGCTPAVAVFTVNIFPDLQNVTITSAGTSLNGTNVCYGKYAQLSVPGYTGNPNDLKWEYQDDGGPFLYWANGNNVNTNSMKPDCSSNNTLFIKRTYRVTYTGPGMTTSPPPCAKGAAWIRIHCPTIGGSIIPTQQQYCLQPGHNSIDITFTLTGYKGTTDWPAGNTKTVTLGPGTHVITATVQNGPCNPVTATTTVKIFAPVTCSISPGTLTVCPNQDAVVTVNSSNAGPNAQIQWQYSIDDNDNICDNNNPNPWINSGTGPSQNTNEIGDQGPYSPVPQNNILWRAIVTNPDYNGTGACKSCTSCVRINIIPKICSPFITSQPGNNLKCAGTVITLKANLPPGCNSSSYTYQWFLDGEPVTGISSGNTFTGALPGNYQVQVKNDCDSALSPIHLIKDCVFDLAIQGPCCSSPGQKAVFKVTDPDGGNNLSSCGGPYKFQWRVAGVTAPIGTGQSVSVSPTTTTTYEVTVTDSKGCQSKISVTLLVCL